MDFKASLVLAHFSTNAYISPFQIRSPLSLRRFLVTHSCRSLILPRSRPALGVSQYVYVHSKMKWAPPHGRCVFACQAATPLIPVSPGSLLSLQVVTELFSVVIRTFLVVTGFPDENYLYTGTSWWNGAWLRLLYFVYSETNFPLAIWSVSIPTVMTIL